MKSLILAFALTATMFTPKQTADLYTMETIAMRQNTEYVQLMSNDGNLWELGTDEIKLGDVVTCVMSDNGTAEIEDDIIVSFEVMPR